MIEANISLRRYIEGTELPTRTSCDQFIAGVASYLAVTSWLDWFEQEQKKSLGAGCEVLEVAPVPNEEAVHHAYFFAGAMVANDPHIATNSLAVTLACAWRRMWPEAAPDDWIGGSWAAELGWCLAAEADGSGAGWEDDDYPPHGMRPPRIEACSGDYFVMDEEICSDVDVMSKRIIIVGPGGSGKDYLAQKLEEAGFRKAVSHTTRPPRVGEVDGVSYHFTTDKEFRQGIKNDEFKEWYSFGPDNWLYGTSMAEFRDSSLFIMSPPVLPGLGDALHDFVVVYLDIPAGMRRIRLEARADADSADRRLAADAEDFRDFALFDVRITDPCFTVEAVLSEINAI